MANDSSLCLLFLSLLFIFSSGTILGFQYPEIGDTSSKTTFLQKDKIFKFGVPLVGEVITKYLEARSHFAKRIAALYGKPHTTQENEFNREKSSKVNTRRTLEENTNNPPVTVFPTNPTSTTPPINPTPDTPTIITVPSTSPTVTVPSSTPVPLPPTNPANPGGVPTNPVASSYPPPSPSVPTVLNPPPANTNAQTALNGQSWCVAKTGVSETILQSALDYACGMGTVDCSQIQQGGSCYNPNSIQNHASFAFNSYYQKNPAPTSCDFGGAATIVNTNPSSGSCIYPSSSGGGTSSSASPPSAFGSQSAPGIDASDSASLRPFLGCMVLLLSLVIGRLSMST